MSTSPLILWILALTLFLFFLVAILVFRSRPKVVKEEVIKGPPTFEELKSILKNKDTHLEILRETLDEIVDLYGNIEEKKSGRPSKDFERYMEVILIVCKHPNSNKHLVLNFEKDLARKNPQYKRDIDSMVTKGLSYR